MTQKHSDDHHDRAFNLLGVGSFSDVLVPLAQRFAQLKVQDQILSIGRAEFHRPNTTDDEARFDFDGVVNISPPLANFPTGSGLVGSQEVAASYRDLWLPLLAKMHASFLRLLQEADLVDAVVIWLQSISSGHTTLGDYFLRQLHIDQPLQHRLILTILPQHAGTRDNVRDDPDLLARLVDEGIAKAIVLLDELSPLALQHQQGSKQQLALATTGLATLVAGSSYDQKQRPFADVARWFRESSAWVASSYATRPIVGLRSISWWDSGPGRFGGPQRAMSDLSQTTTAVKEAIKEALSSEHTKALDEPFCFDGHCFLGLTVPLRPEDPNWTELKASITHWLVTTYPRTITPIFCPGNGVPDSRFKEAYWCQASMYWPTAKQRPAAIQRIIDEPVVKLRRVSVNGNGAAKEHGQPSATETRLRPPALLPVLEEGGH